MAYLCNLLTTCIATDSTASTKIGEPTDDQKDSAKPNVQHNENKPKKDSEEANGDKLADVPTASDNESEHSEGHESTMFEESTSKLSTQVNTTSGHSFACVFSVHCLSG